MKIPGAGGRVRGSMGIPPEIHPDKVFGQNEAEPAESESGTEEQPPKPVYDDGFATKDEAPAAAAPEPLAPDAVTDERVKQELLSPLHVLKKIGIDFNEDDCSRLLFKGFVEKTVPVCLDPKTKKMFTATIKSLTGEEYDLVDELMGEEIKTRDMTQRGFDTRKNMWTMAIATTKLMGNPICKPVMTKGNKVDEKSTVRKKHEVISKLSPAVLNKMMAIFGTFTTQLDAIVEDPEKAFLNKP